MLLTAFIILLGTIVILILGANISARKKMHGSYIEQETIEFVTAGDNPRGGTLIDILPNSKGQRYVERDDIKKEYGGKIPYEIKYKRLINPKDTPDKWEWEDETHIEPINFAIVSREDAIKYCGEDVVKGNWFARFLREKFGWHYVSILYPARHVLEFYVKRVRMRPFTTSEASKVDINDLIDTSRKEDKPEWVKFLLMRFPRPVLCPDIEFSDAFTANILVYLQFKVVIPLNTILVWKERFFEQLESVIVSAIGDALKNISYSNFVKYFPLKPNSVFFDGFLAPLNMILIPKFGVEIVSGSIVARELSGASKEREEALQAAETERLLAEAAVEKAEGERKALETVGQGKANALRLQLDAVGSEILKKQLDVDRLKALGGQVTTYVESGANASVLVGTTSTDPKTKPKNEEST